MATKSTFLYQEIAEAVRRRIASGQLQPGDRLPPVRKMAERWNCTPGTVSRAYRLLAEEALVVAHRGSGTRVVQNALQPESPAWQWASMVNKAEHYLLTALASGYSPAEAQSALTLAVARWNALESRQGVLPVAGTAAAPLDRHLRFSGSHDLLLQILARSLADTDPGLSLDMDFTGSLGGLMALARGEADVAGVHLWDAESGLYNEPFIRRVLPGRHCGMVTLAHRSLGLIVAADNPLRIQTLADLVQEDVRFVNRQQGSGTRVWLDARLRAEGIDSGRVQGYQQVRTTHTEVAEAVSQGEADAGLGIYAAAAAYGLDFVILVRERYDLVFREAVWETEMVATIREHIRSERFRQSVAALGGYDIAETGRETVF